MRPLQGCRGVSERLVELTGLPRPLEGAGAGAAGEYTCAWGARCCGGGLPNMAALLGI